MHLATTVLLLLFGFFLCSSAAHIHRRHLLHQPFFPVTTAAPPTQPPSSSSEPPSPSPFGNSHSHHQQEKHPFSSGTTTYAPPQHNPFFPSSDPTSTAPPPPSRASLATFPANISSLVFPNHNSDLKSQHVRHVTKLVALTISVISAALLLSLLAFLLLFFRHRHRSSPADDAKSSRSDSLRLFNTAPSDGALQHKQPPKYNSTNTSSEFLYLGTLVNSRSGGLEQQKTVVSGNAAGVMGIPFPASTSSSSQYQKLDSPEVRPLPPLPKYNVFTPTYQSGEQLNPKVDDDGDENDGENENENDEFFSPRGSSGRKQSPTRVWSSSRRELQGIGADHFGSTSFNSRTASYPYSNSCSPTDSMSSTSTSPTTNPSPTSLKPMSPDLILSFQANSQSLNPLSSFASPALGYGGAPVSLHRQSSQNDGLSEQSGSVKLPPPPPPPPPPSRFWEIPVSSRITQARDMNAGPTVSSVSSDTAESGNSSKEETKEEKKEHSEKEETLKPKLKPLHWDKVRASSSRVMVWDQIKSSSFQLNEEMIETLFRVNDASSRTRDHGGGREAAQSSSQENRLLDPKKSQNIAILLRALNVTIDEVCEALSEGNTETLGPELLECVLKMAPSKEEENKLKEAKDDESPSKLGPAEKFLKALLHIPFAFKRIEAMLYILNFDSEIDYLQRSFETLEAACGELKNTRMFLKLLEAVLKTGNRMNVGTNRGDAQAFKLDTLLKLVDVKGTDGKTTLLHFVVQEIIKSEGTRHSTANQNPKNENKTEQSAFQNDLELRKLGLQVVSSLSSQMMNVKKAGAMESDVLSNDITQITKGITKVREVIERNQETGLNEKDNKFLEAMNSFMNRAEKEITLIQNRGSNALNLVKEVTEYFHGNSEAHPFRIFMVVRDFLGILDQVCKEVGRINERTVVGSLRPSATNTTQPFLFPGLNTRHSSDDESS